MINKTPFYVYCLIGIIGGVILAALSLLFMGAGHSPYIETLSPLMYTGLIIAAGSAIALFINVVKKIFERIKR